MHINKEKLEKEIKEVSNSLYRSKSLSDYNCKLNTLLMLCNLYKDLSYDDIKITVPSIKEYNAYLYKKQGALDYTLDAYFFDRKEHSHLSGKVLTTYNRSGFYDRGGEHSTRKIDDKTKFELINDFLGDYDKRVQKQFNYMQMNGLIDTNAKDIIDCATYSIFDKSKSYILLDKFKSIYDIDILMHELGHAYSFSVISNRSKSQSMTYHKSYYEMYSMYMELSFQEFLKKNHIFLKDALLTENNYYAFMYYYFNFLKNSNEIEDDDTLTFDDMEYIKNAFIYSYGYYIALLVHEKSMSDKEGTKERLDDYLAYQGLIDYDKQLEILGLTRDGLKNMKVLRKRLKTHVEDIEKYRNI